MLCINSLINVVGECRQYQFNKAILTTEKEAGWNLEVCLACHPTDTNASGEAALLTENESQNKKVDYTNFKSRNLRGST